MKAETKTFSAGAGNDGGEEFVIPGIGFWAYGIVLHGGFRARSLFSPSLTN